MNNFLRTGQKSGDAAAAASSSADRTEHMDHDADCEVKMNVEQPPQPDDAVWFLNQPKIAIDIDNVLKVIENAENAAKPSQAGSASSQTSHGERPASSQSESQAKGNCDTNKRGAVTGPDHTKPLQPKAKLLRQSERNGHGIDGRTADGQGAEKRGKNPEVLHRRNAHRWKTQIKGLWSTSVRPMTHPSLIMNTFIDTCILGNVGSIACRLYGSRTESLSPLPNRNPQWSTRENNVFTSRWSTVGLRVISPTVLAGRWSNCGGRHRYPPEMCELRLLFLRSGYVKELKRTVWDLTSPILQSSNNCHNLFFCACFFPSKTSISSPSAPMERYVKLISLKN